MCTYTSCAILKDPISRLWELGRGCNHCIFGSHGGRLCCGFEKVPVSTNFQKRSNEGKSECLCERQRRIGEKRRVPSRPPSPLSPPTPQCGITSVAWIIKLGPLRMISKTIPSRASSCPLGWAGRARWKANFLGVSKVQQHQTIVSGEVRAGMQWPKVRSAECRRQSENMLLSLPIKMPATHPSRTLDHHALSLSPAISCCASFTRKLIRGRVSFAYGDGGRCD